MPQEGRFGSDIHVHLCRLLAALKRRGYAFVTPTPATHARVLARDPGRVATSLTDVFGWSLPFGPNLLDDELRGILRDGDLLEAAADGSVKARVRVSWLGGELYLHSAYPTLEENAVFFGPDSYRFANLTEAVVSGLDREQVKAIVDFGTGAGVGAIVTAQRCPGARVIGIDVNPDALVLAAANAAAATVTVETRLGDTSSPVGGPIDLALANPPYIIDRKGREYRDGGSLHGAQVAVEMVQDGLSQLSEHGVMVLYTGTAIVAGRDLLLPELARLADQYGTSVDYRCLDPDVFGEELERPEYRDVDRIALVSALFRR